MKKYRVAIITASDKGAKGERLDESGAYLMEKMTAEGFLVIGKEILPDEESLLVAAMMRICDEGLVDLILTTGGTGFSKRDCTPEATNKVIQRQAPGLAEGMREASMKITPMGMLSRGICGIRKETLIINLPGSLKAVKENLAVVLPVLSHGLSLLTDNQEDRLHQ